MERFDFHMHSIFSDGELIPAEIARRCQVLGHKAIAITDHGDNSNLEMILKNLVPACQELEKHYDMEIIPGIELTHTPLRLIPKLARDAKKMGARIVVLHGETIAEPVLEGTNKVGVETPEIDIIAHPGFISVQEAKIAAENNIYLELTSRKGHSLTNGHVAKVAMESGAKLLLNTDSHSPDDLISYERALKIAMGAGLNQEDSEKILEVNPVRFLGEL